MAAERRVQSTARAGGCCRTSSSCVGSAQQRPPSFSRSATAAVSDTPSGRRQASRIDPGASGKLASSLLTAGIAVMPGMARPAALG
jgi:hypothetical protein